MAYMSLGIFEAQFFRATVQVHIHEVKLLKKFVFQFLV